VLPPPPVSRLPDIPSWEECRAFSQALTNLLGKLQDDSEAHNSHHRQKAVTWKSTAKDQEQWILQVRFEFAQANTRFAAFQETHKK
jgi:hypothetical protein